MHSRYTLYRVIHKIVLKHKQYSLLYIPLNIEHKCCLEVYFFIRWSEYVDHFGSKIPQWRPRVTQNLLWGTILHVYFIINRTIKAMSV